MGKALIEGPRSILELGKEGYPSSLGMIAEPPERLHVIGDPAALEEGIAIIGARRATPYGLSCAHRFARIAAEKGVCIVSGGARGCDSEAHRAALEVQGRTVVFLGGGCDEIYPRENFDLFQKIVDSGGAIVSEWDWTMPPLPYMFRRRNRLIAGLARAVLIVEAGLPSGTFSTADDALESGKDVLVVPGAITSDTSLGANRLLYQGALPIIDDESYEEALFNIFGALKRPGQCRQAGGEVDPIIEAIRAEPLSNEELNRMAESLFGVGQARDKLNGLLIEAELAGTIARRPDGRWTARIRG